MMPLLSKCRRVAALVVTWAAVAVAAPPREVVVASPRVRVGDLVPNVAEAVAIVDVGPSPAAGVSKLVTRADIVSALTAKQIAAPPAIPEVVRVVRKVRRVTTSDFDAIVRRALAANPLGKGVTFIGVRVEHAVDVPDGWSRVDMDIPRAPKRAGPFQTVAIASFVAERDLLARVLVPLDLAVSPEGAVYDVLRGSPVGVVLRRGCVEVRTTGFAGVDADVGDRLPVQLRPSGRVLRTRLVAADEALVLEDGQ
jgi:hypothetical protein